MSTVEKAELTALAAWLRTFPQIEVPDDKENVGGSSNFDVLQDSGMASMIFDVALEVCNVEGCDESTVGLTGDVWDTIMSLTRRTNKMKSAQVPAADAHHQWEDFTKHAALANLLDGAVMHKNSRLRRAYIERIMKLSPTIQRTLMALIERRKKKSRASVTPSKRNRSTKKASKVATPSRSDENPSTEKRIGTPASSDRPVQRNLPVDHRSPLSPRDNYPVMTADSTSGRKPVPHPRDRPALATPRQLNPATTRRNFDEAFGHPTTRYAIAEPSPKRVLVAENRTFFSPGLGDTAEYEKEVQGLRERNEHLAAELEKTKRREEEINQKYEEVEAKFRMESMKIETASRHREEETRAEFTDKLESLQMELDRMKEEYATAKGAEAELAKMKDEMEVMAHTKTMLAETSERLRAYKEKVQHLADVKEALQREEEAHGKSVDEVLRLENELKALEPLKRQLDEYKTRAVEAEVKVSESQDELLKAKQDRLTAAESVRQMQATVESQREEIEDLRSRAKQEEVTDADATGVGKGISELNPELKEEVLRLRNENEKLREFASKREDDAVARLEQSLEDAVRLSDRYKSQYFSTKARLETCQGDLEESETREVKLKEQLSTSKGETTKAQETANDLSEQLLKRSEDLKDSKSREERLENELAAWEEQVKTLQKQSKDLSGRLKRCSKELEEAIGTEHNLRAQLSNEKESLASSEQKREQLSFDLDACRVEVATVTEENETLQEEVGKLKTKLEESETQSSDVSQQLQKRTIELEAARARLSGLERDLDEKVREAAERQDVLEKESSQYAKQLSEAEVKLQEGQEREVKLQNDLADMTSRAEDSEMISKQRMELVKSTRDKLMKSEEAISQQRKNQDALNEEVAEWATKTSAALRHVEQLEQELSESQEALKKSNESLTTSEASVSDLEKKVGQLEKEHEQLKREHEELTEKAGSAEGLTERLQEELVQTREVLNKTQNALQVSQSNEKVLKQEMDNAEQLMFNLEDEVEKEMKAKEEAEEKLDKAVEESTRREKLFEATRSRLQKRIADEMQQSNKFKQDLFHTQETLNETQSSLAASQHREKMLKHEVAKLKDDHMDLERALEVAKKRTNEATEEASRSLTVTRETLNSKLQEEMDDLQRNMNQLLEDERKAKRQVGEACQAKIAKLQKDFEAERADMKKTANEELEALRKESAERYDKVKLDLEKQIEDVKRIAAEENAKLILKGKGMIRDMKNQAQEEYIRIKAEYNELEGKLVAERTEKTSLALQYKNKVVQYKKKLTQSTGRISSLSADSNDLGEKIRSLEREKLKLQDENERYRRQLGGSYGADSKLQNQLEKVQKEFKNALDEIRELRVQRSNGSVASLPSFQEGADNSYSRDVVNHSTISQLRSEYEETIEALNDEKRELVMRNSAAITDVQKAEKRAWMAEQECGSLKQEVTSMKLQVERLENILHTVQEEETSTQAPAAADDHPVFLATPIQSQTGHQNNVLVRSSSLPVHSPTTSVQSSSDSIQKSRTLPTSSAGIVSSTPDFAAQATASRPTPQRSFVGQTTKPPEADKPPECKQC